jgi:hypothetical protein
VNLTDERMISNRKDKMARGTGRHTREAQPIRALCLEANCSFSYIMQCRERDAPGRQHLAHRSWERGENRFCNDANVDTMIQNGNSGIAVRI